MQKHHCKNAKSLSFQIKGDRFCQQNKNYNTVRQCQLDY